ncbi:MAG: protein phosphatase 2C domain-containing protein [Candidatus Limnocylindrales bacterium]
MIAPRLQAVALTDAGRSPSGNEDAVLASGLLIAVADGSGGLDHGEVASSMAIATLMGLGPEPDPRSLVPALLRVNADIRTLEAGALGHGAGAPGPAVTPMGTTCTVAVVHDGRVHIAHLGDSRAYLFRDDTLHRLTEDDDQGTSALGLDEQPTIDSLAFPLRAGDRLVVCTDGLHRWVSDAAIAAALVAASSPGPAAADLVELANAAGATDNVSVVVADYLGEPVDIVPATGGEGADAEPHADAADEAAHEGPSPVPLVLAALTIAALLVVITATVMLNLPGQAG